VTTDATSLATETYPTVPSPVTGVTGSAQTYLLFIHASAQAVWDGIIRP
jgi:hypothetical protein